MSVRDVWPKRPPSTPEEARRSQAARRALDEFEASHVPADERESLLEFWRAYDARHRIREERALLAEAAEVQDSVPGMLRRSEQLICELLDQIAGGTERGAA